MGFFKGLLDLFLSKKKIIAYISALIIAGVAAFLGMTSQEVKEAVIAGPTIELPKMQTAAPVSMPAAVEKK